MFRIRLLTFCTVPHAAQFAPTICANLRWQPLQLLMVGPDAISLILSGGMSTISKLLEAVSFWRMTLSSRRMRSTSTGAVAHRKDRAAAPVRLVGHPQPKRIALLERLGQLANDLAARPNGFFACGVQVGQLQAFV